MPVTSPIHSPRGQFTLLREQEFPRPLEEVFEFFGDYRNLERITPPWLKFQITRASSPVMRKGMTIDYRLKLRGIPVRWKTLISHWEPPFSFVDEQMMGPYRVWIHRHEFEPTENGTLVRDRIDYSVPGGWLIERFFVRKDLEKIFDYRAEQLEEILG